MKIHRVSKNFWRNLLACAALALLAACTARTYQSASTPEVPEHVERTFAVTQHVDQTTGHVYWTTNRTYSADGATVQTTERLYPCTKDTPASQKCVDTGNHD